MGRKKREQRRKSSSPEEDEADESSSSSSSNEKEQASSPKQRKKQVEKEVKEREKMRGGDSHQDRNAERSRWESPDRRKRKHSPSSGQNRSEERRRGQRVRQDGSEARTKWDKNDREREPEKEGGDKRRKEERKREREVPERMARNENNRENRTDERFEGRRQQNDRKSPRRDEQRNRGFDERERRGRGGGGGGGNERGGHRGGGRENRFRNNDGPWNKFDGSRMKSEPSPDWGRGEMKKEDDDGKPVDKEKPNFEPSGKLTEDSNTVNGVVIKYTEPMEARKPKRRWRLYPFKGEKALPTLYVHRQSAYLMGRDRKVADIPLDHPSCSKQHAALQFRLVPFQRENGGEGKRIRPYLIDLESANGTSVNDVKLEARRYHELMERDVLRFGFSSREYVLLHEQSKDDALDDDVPPPAPAPK